MGGGGLITVPALTILLGPGAQTIGTNKILAVTSTLSALIVYARKGHLDIKKGIPFLITVAIGTVVGAKAAPLLPVDLFNWFLLIVCPVILWVVLKKDSFHTKLGLPKEQRLPWMIGLGLLCGFYDGVFGPGGGTFMFLSLNLLIGLPLLGAIATAKLANVVSASGSLFTYSLQDLVLWDVGLKYAGFVLIGSVLGSLTAHSKAPQIVRPLLVVVILLLMGRIAQTLFFFS